MTTRAPRALMFINNFGITFEAYEHFFYQWIDKK